jgi:hypothetical protein
MDNNLDANEVARSLEQSVRDTIKNEIMCNLKVTIEKVYRHSYSGEVVISVKLYYEDSLVSEDFCYAN